MARWILLLTARKAPLEAASAEIGDPAR